MIPKIKYIRKDSGNELFRELRKIKPDYKWYVSYGKSGNHCKTLGMAISMWLYWFWLPRKIMILAYKLKKHLKKNDKQD